MKFFILIALWISPLAYSMDVSPCTMRAYQQSCLSDLADAPVEKRVSVIEVPDALHKQMLNFRRVAILDSYQHHDGALLFVQSLNSDAMKNLVKGATANYSGSTTACILLKKQSEVIQFLKSKIVGTAQVNMSPVEIYRKGLVPNENDLKFGTVLKIDDRRFVVVEKTIVRTAPYLTLDEIPGEAEPYVITTGHRQYLHYTSDFLLNGKKTINKLGREGDVELSQVPRSYQFRIERWITRAEDERTHTVGPMIYSDFKPE